jgi:hypothetical protein
MNDRQLADYAKENNVPLALVKETAKNGHLPGLFLRGCDN